MGNVEWALEQLTELEVGSDGAVSVTNVWSDSILME